MAAKRVRKHPRENRQHLTRPNRDRVFVLRVTQEELDMYGAAARMADRSVSSWIRKALESVLKESR